MFEVDDDLHGSDQEMVVQWPPDHDADQPRPASQAHKSFQKLLQIIQRIVHDAREQLNGHEFFRRLYLLTTGSPEDASLAFDGGPPLADESNTEKDSAFIIPIQASPVQAHE